MTATRCTPGDLAIVISAYLDENLGSLVEVIGPPTGVPFAASWPGVVWQVRTVSGRATLVYKFGTGQCSRAERHSEGPVPDFSLRPLPGIEDTDELERFVEIPVGTRIAVEVS